MRNSDLIVRIASGFELIAILFNLFSAFVWFIALIMVIVGIGWLFVGLLLLGQLGVAIFNLVRGYTPVGAIAAPVIGLLCSLFNVNIFGGLIEAVVLAAMIAAIVLRGQEDAAGAA